MTLTLKIVNNFFRKKHNLMIIHHHTKFGKKMVQRFRRYWADMIGHQHRTTDGRTDRQTDKSNLPPLIAAAVSCHQWNCAIAYFKNSVLNPSIFYYVTMLLACGAKRVATLQVFHAENCEFWLAEVVQVIGSPATLYFSPHKHLFWPQPGIKQV